jgi:uncharacterized protein YkwD
VKSAWRFLERVWLLRRSIAWAASVSIAAVIVSFTLNMRSLSTTALPPRSSYQSHSGATLLTPTPTATPSPTVSTKPSGSSTSCPPVAGHEDTTTEAWLLNAVNQARASAGVAALTIDPRIHNEALIHSGAMTCYGMSHYVPPGTTPETRMTAAGVTFTWSGENIGWSGRGTSMDKIMWLFNTMMAEQPPNDGHRKNILSSHFTRTGIGIYVENASGRLWLTEDFAG